MTNTNKEWREEWLKHCDDDSSTVEGKLNGYSFVIFDEDANKIADWWLDKLHKTQVETAKAILEEVGPEYDIEKTADYYKMKMQAINDERNRFKQILSTYLI